MAGYDLEIHGPEDVSLEIEMMVCVDSDYFRSNVLAALEDVFSSDTLAEGSLGFFHPDNFTFGQSIYLSQLYAAAQTSLVCATSRLSPFSALTSQAPPDSMKVC
jgi:hypothetical protein